MKKSIFKIQTFDDYHSIYDKNDYKTIELGCFPEKGYGYFRYYGLFYKGRRPSFDKILDNCLKKMPSLPYDYNFPYINGSITKDDIINDIKNTLKVI